MTTEWVCTVGHPERHSSRLVPITIMYQFHSLILIINNNNEQLLYSADLFTKQKLKVLLYIICAHTMNMVSIDTQMCTQPMFPGMVYLPTLSLTPKTFSFLPTDALPWSLF